MYRKMLLAAVVVSMATSITAQVAPAAKHQEYHSRSESAIPIMLPTRAAVCQDPPYGSIGTSTRARRI